MGNPALNWNGFESIEAALVAEATRRLHPEPTRDAPNFLEDAYHCALDKLVMSRTFMTLSAQQAFDEEWERHMRAENRTADP